MDDWVNIVGRGQSTNQIFCSKILLSQKHIPFAVDVTLASSISHLPREREVEAAFLELVKRCFPPRL